MIEGPAGGGGACLAIIAGAHLKLGYQVNSNLNHTFGYKSTVNDSAPGDLKMDSFMITLVYGWHTLIEGSKRLKSE
jgi:hypothetical protein